MCMEYITVCIASILIKCIHVSFSVCIHTFCIDSFFHLQCSVEAFPEAVNYWERHDGRLIQSTETKYMLTSTFDGYKTDLSLNVSLSEPSDFGTYYCISKNPKGLTKAAMELFGKKQGRAPFYFFFFFSNNTKPLFKLNFVGRNVFSGKWVLNNLTFTYLN